MSTPRDEAAGLDRQDAILVGPHEASLLELVRLDYDVTLRTISGILATGTSIRVAGFAAWGALVGFAIRDESWPLGAAATAVILLFMYVDAYHASLYGRLLKRAIRLEAILDRYVNRLGIDSEDEDAVLEVIAELETHRFGTYRTLRRVTAEDLRSVTPRAVFRRLYPGLVLVAVVVVTWAVLFSDSAGR